MQILAAIPSSYYVSFTHTVWIVISKVYRAYLMI